MAMYDPQEEQILGLREQKAFARKLREEAMNAPQGQMVSGWYVRPSITQYLAQGLKGYLGGQEQAQAEQGLQDIRNQQEGRRQAFLSNMPQPTTTQVEDRSGMNPMMRGPSPVSKNVTVNPTMEQMLGWASTAPNLDTGTIAQLALKGVETKELAQERARQAEAARAEKMAFEERENQRNREARLETAKLAASLRPERIVNILGPNGESVATPISQVPAGASLWSPQAAKFAQENASKGTGRAALSDTLNTLAGQYNALNQGMGIESTQNKFGSNLGAWAGSTGFGNWVGRKFGSENAKARDIIDQTRPLLLADIKKATGMTASEMNSNAELQMWLSVATDPTKGYEANMEALKNLENKFGLGRAKDGNPFLKASPAVNQNVTVDY